MPTTDLDWLIHEASPEEVKQLMRIAHEWSQGDEHSFPVQLALLTRAQWRAAAQIPQLLDKSRARLDSKMDEHRQQIAMLVENFSGVTEAKINALAHIVTTHSQSMTRATSGMTGHLAEASHVAERICDELRRGASVWQSAKEQFEIEQRKLEQARQELERRRTWDEWFAVGIILLTMIDLGIAIGLGLRRGVI